MAKSSCWGCWHVCFEHFLTYRKHPQLAGQRPNAYVTGSQVQLAHSPPPPSARSKWEFDPHVPGIEEVAQKEQNTSSILGHCSTQRKSEHVLPLQNDLPPKTHAGQKLGQSLRSCLLPFSSESIAGFVLELRDTRTKAGQVALLSGCSNTSTSSMMT